MISSERVGKCDERQEFKSLVASTTGYVAGNLLKPFHYRHRARFSHVNLPVSRVIYPTRFEKTTNLGCFERSFLLLRVYDCALTDGNLWRKPRYVVVLLAYEVILYVATSAV